MPMNNTLPRTTQPLLLDLLQRRGLLDAKKQETVRAAHLKAATETIEEILARLGYVSDHDIAAVYAEHLMLPLFEPPAHGGEIDR